MEILDHEKNVTTFITHDDTNSDCGMCSCSMKTCVFMSLKVCVWGAGGGEGGGQRFMNFHLYFHGHNYYNDKKVYSPYELMVVLIFPLWPEHKLKLEGHYML